MDAKAKPISTRQAMLQVLAIRPNAKVVERSLGRWLVVDGNDELNATERGAGRTPGDAWKDALDWLLFLHSQGIDPGPHPTRSAP